MHADLVPPEDAERRPAEERAAAPWRTEHDVVSTLTRLGHSVTPLGVRSDLGVIGAALQEVRPHIAFNLLEEFDGRAIWDHNVVSYLEMMRTPYTGCNPRGLMLSRDKALSKQILAYHRVPVPDFAVYPFGRPARRAPRRLRYPLFVKSLVEEASLGIAQASIVEDDARLAERVAFIHDRIGTDALVEQYIEGRELYVGVLGNRRLMVLPVWELLFTRMPDDVPRIATRKVKWDPAYQKKRGIVSRAADDLPPGAAEGIARLARRIYRLLGLTGCARIDLRLDAAGRIWVLEANPNPQLARGEDFADSAVVAGIAYEELLQRLLTLGLRRGAAFAAPP